MRLRCLRLRLGDLVLVDDSQLNYDESSLQL